jgi:hypothetical protein
MDKNQNFNQSAPKEKEVMKPAQIPNPYAMHEHFQKQDEAIHHCTLNKGNNLNSNASDHRKDCCGGQKCGHKVEKFGGE